MKVMRPHVHITECQDMHGGRSHIDNAILILKRAIDAQKLSARHSDAVPFIQLRMDDGVRNSRFIFEAKKDEALSCTRTLPSDDRACDAGIHLLRVLPADRMRV